MTETKQNKQADSNTENHYLHGSVSRLFAKTATPIILMMIVNGLFTIIDAFFLGYYVGADALTAVTLMFPFFMIIISLSTLVGNGMASIVARQLGAREFDEANRTFMSAHILAFALCIFLMLVFYLLGAWLINALANNTSTLAEMGNAYIAPLIYGSPLAFVLNVQSDALRSEGRAGFMAIMAVSVTLLNILFNYVLIAKLGYGVLGSALGTLLAQGVAALIIAWARRTGRTPLKMFAPLGPAFTKCWGNIIALGAPSAVNYLGSSIISALVIISVQSFVAEEAYAATVAAYGIVTRLSIFTFLPMLGFNLAAQSIIGNNIGAGMYLRSNAALKIVLLVTLVYSLVVEVVLISLAGPLTAIFTDDASVIAVAEYITPIIFSLFFVFGQILILGGYFQARGEAKLAAIFGLGKTYLFSIPFIILLPQIMGEIGIWIASPASEMAMLLVAIIVLTRVAHKTGARYGVFMAPQENK